MSKPIREADLIEFPFEDSQQFGRNHVRDNFTVIGGSNYEQRQYFRVWYRALKNIAISSIKWNNVPAGVDTRAMEYILLHFGCGGMFEESGGLLFAQATFADMVNLYYNPNEVMLCAPSGQYWYRHAQPWGDTLGIVHDPDCAVCWDNMLREPLLITIRRYAERIARYDYVMDMNIDAQLTPWVIAASPEKGKQRTKLRRKLERQDQYWEVTEAGAEELPYILQTGAPFVADKIETVKLMLINEVLTFLGVDNTNVNKKERVQTAEVLSNNGMIISLRESRLKAREQFCDTANVLFANHGTLDDPISVEWGIEGSIADIAAAMTGGGFASLVQAMNEQQQLAEGF